MPPDPSSDPAVDRIAGSRDERLRLARRIDARFLLSDPELGRVVLVGPADADLRAAISDGDGTAVGGTDLTGSADTVLLCGRIDGEALVAAVNAAGRTGRLIVERDVRRPGVPARSLGASRIARCLAAGGWGAVATWLTWPTRERATVWARVDDPVALRALVARRLGGTRAERVAGLAGRVAAWAATTQAGRLALLSIAPSITVVAERAPGVASHISARLATDRGVLVLTPRYRASAHVVALALDPATDAPVRVMKIARLRDDAGLRHEAGVLAALDVAAADEMGEDRGPRLLAADTADGPHPSLVEGGIPGAPLDPRSVRMDRSAAVAGIATWVATLPAAPADARRMPVRVRLADAAADVCRLEAGVPVAPGVATDAVGRATRAASATVATGELAALVRRTELVTAGLDAARLPAVFEHGDAAHPNLIRRPDGRIDAVDWERGEPDGLPLHDLTIALAYVAAADASATDPGAQAAAFKEALAGRDAWAVPVLHAELVRLGVDPIHRDALVVAAWLRSAAWLARALAPTGPGTSVAGWLAADRSSALWRASLEVAEGVATGRDR
jgi:hypothetical protein